MQQKLLLWNSAGNWRAVCCDADRIWCQTRSASWETLTINMAAAAFLSCFSQQIWHGLSMLSCVSVDIPQCSWQCLSLCWCWETDSRCRDDATCKQLMGFKTNVVLRCTDADPAGAQTHMNYFQLHDSSTVISINKLPTSFCINCKCVAFVDFYCLLFLSELCIKMCIMTDF